MAAVIHVRLDATVHCCQLADPGAARATLSSEFPRCPIENLQHDHLFAIMSLSTTDSYEYEGHTWLHRTRIVVSNKMGEFWPCTCADVQIGKYFQ
jgi:hypothetical protein